jgi:transcriptional regulator with XRE-family HTH domain
MKVSLGKRIKAMRAIRGLKQWELAEKAEVRQPTLSEFEHDKTRPCEDTLERIKAALYWSPDEDQMDAAFAILAGDGIK